MRTLRFLSVGIIVLQFAPLIFAEELPTLYRGIRPLGMGGAFITLSNDENALFYNPAGLNDVKGFGGIEILNPQAAASENALGLYQDVKDVESTDETQVVDLLQKHIGEHQHLKTSFFPNFYMHNFAIGILGQGTLDLEVRNPAFPEVVSDAKVDLAGLVGGAYGLWDRRLQIGVTGKLVRREGVKKTFQPADIVVEFDPFKDRESETDFAFDVGTKLNVPILLEPSVALVLQNITDLDFGTLGEIPQQLNMGVGINPSFWIVGSSVILEVDDITKEVGTDQDLYKRVHMGAEIRFPVILSLRVGVNQGYYTAGATFDFTFLKLSYATYDEEVGASAGQRGDRRHVAQISLGF